MNLLLCFQFLGLEPKFCDIDEESPNISPENVADSLDNEVTGILPVHCYGIPCDVDKFSKLQSAHNLKLIYDAAHCVSISVNGESIFEFGDSSVVSMHATKVLNSIEGGAVFSPNTELMQKIKRMRNLLNLKIMDLVSIIREQ